MPTELLEVFIIASITSFSDLEYFKVKSTMLFFNSFASAILSLAIPALLTKRSMPFKQPSIAFLKSPARE